MKYTTETRVRREVERAVEGALDKWATGDSKAETAIYVTNLHLTAAPQPPPQPPPQRPCDPSRSKGTPTDLAMRVRPEFMRFSHSEYPTD